MLNLTTWIDSTNNNFPIRPVRAYAAASINHPKMFDKLAKHIVLSDHLNQFKPEELSNTVWAYATAQISHSKLFQEVAKNAIQRKKEFNSQDVVNTLWAYASYNGYHRQAAIFVFYTDCCKID